MDNPNSANSIYKQTKLDDTRNRSRTLNRNKINGLFLIVPAILIITLVTYLVNYYDIYAEALSQIRTDSINNLFQPEKSHELFDKIKYSVVRIDTLAQNVNPKVTVDDQPFLSDPVGLIGSGFIYDKGGKIVTNYHVIRDAQAILVKFLNGNGYRATVVGIEPLIDLAVLQLDPSSLYREKIDPLPLANKTKIKVGTPVVAIGSPIGLTGSMTEGIISQIDRIQKSLFFPNSWVGDLIQTDAPINHGNSGGPLLNLDGEVVGVNDRGVFSDVNSQSIEPNIGLDISAETTKRIVDNIIANGSFNNPYLGIVISDIPPFFPERVGLSEAKGAYVLSVIPDGPASKVQIEPNNVIIKADDIFIRDKADLINYIQTKSPNDTISLSIIDNKGITNTADVVLESMPQEFGG